MQDTIVILEEINLPHLHNPECDVFVLWKALNSLHLNMYLYARGGDRKCCGLAEEETQTGSVIDFQSYDHPLSNVMRFKYLVKSSRPRTMVGHWWWQT